MVIVVYTVGGAEESSELPTFLSLSLKAKFQDTWRVVISWRLPCRGARLRRFP